MFSKNFTKTFRRTSARWAFNFFWALFRRMPYGAVRAMANAMIAIGYRCVGAYRRTAMESLTIAFGQTKSRQELEQISRRCFDNIGQGMIELMYFIGHPSMIKEKVSIEGREHLDAALKRGKGVIGITAHFGNFPLMLLRFAQEGYPTNAIIRPTRDEIIEKRFYRMRTELGLKTVYAHPRTECVSQSIRLLRNNEILFIPLDQHFGAKGGVFVEFFGQQAATATGPAVFAMRTGAPLLPVFTVRDGDDRHKIIIEPSFDLERRDDDDATILETTRKITQIIERYVRQYPYEWGWMHRRWKANEAGSGAK